MASFLYPIKALANRRGNQRKETDILPKYTLNPCNNLVRGWITGLVEIDDTSLEIGFNVPLERSTSVGNRSEMSGSDLKIVIVFE